MKQLLLSTGFNNLDNIDDILDELDNGDDTISCCDYVERMLQENDKR